MNPTFGRVDLGALSLAYLDYGDPDAEVVVLLHGAMGRGAGWDRFARELVAAGFRVLAPDQRGHGRSDKPPARAESYDRDAYVGDLAAFLDALEIASCAIVGHSTGALNALVYAARHPGRVRALVLEEHGVTPRGAAYLDGWRAWLASWPARFASLGAVGAFFDRLRPGYGAHFVEMFEEVADGWRPICDPEVILHTIAGNHARAFWDELRAIECPTLLVKGAESDLPAGEIAEMARVLGHGHALVVPGVGHAVHDEAPATFADACLRFLVADPPRERARLVERQYESGDAAADLDAGRTALVIIDMQAEFVSPDGGPYHVPDAAACVPAVGRLLAGFRARGLPVLHTAFADTHGFLDRPRRGPAMPNRFPELAGRFDDAALFRRPRFAAGLEPRPGEPVILKPSYGAFADTPLETILKNLGCDTVVLAGTLTNFCVGSTARQAYERGLLAVVAADGCASDSRRAHLEELRVLRRGFARVLTVDGILAELEAASIHAAV